MECEFLQVGARRPVQCRRTTERFSISSSYTLTGHELRHTGKYTMSPHTLCLAATWANPTETCTYCTFSAAPPAHTSWHVRAMIWFLWPLCRICTHVAQLRAHTVQDKYRKVNKRCHEKRLTVLTWCRSGTVKYAWQTRTASWRFRSRWLAATQQSYMD